MPDVPPPESLRGDLEAYQSFYQKHPEVKRVSFRFEAIESIAVEKILMHEQSEHAPVKHTWLRTREVLPDDPSTHLAMLAYMSDLDFMSTTMLPHRSKAGWGNIMGTSLDHSIWLSLIHI